MKQDAFFQTIIHHIGGEGNVARKRFDGEHLYITVKDSGMADLEELNRLDGVSGTELNRNILSVTIQEDFLEDVTMAKDFKQLAQNIMTLAGAKENVTSVFHCMTRLRMTVKDVKKVDQKAINDLDGVLGVTYQGGQLQVIIGKDLLKVYDWLHFCCRTAYGSGTDRRRYDQGVPAADLQGLCSLCGQFYLYAAEHRGQCGVLFHAHSGRLWSSQETGCDPHVFHGRGRCTGRS